MSGAEEVLVIRRSRGKLAAWAIVAVVFAVVGFGALYPENIGGMILGVIALLLFGGAAVRMLIWMVRPREVLRAGPDGLVVLAIRPPATLAWGTVTDIRVDRRSGKARFLAITIEDPAQLDRHRQMNRILHSRWFGRVTKLTLAGATLVYEGPGGITDAFDTLREDVTYHGTLEIPTIAWETDPALMTQQLRARWTAAAGRSRPPTGGGDESVPSAGNTAATSPGASTQRLRSAPP
jgi:hypothetical protein